MSTQHAIGRALATLLLLAAVACADSAAPTDPTDPPPPPRAVGSVTLSTATLALEEGAAERLQATARDQAGDVIDGAAITWSSSDAEVVEVAADGALTAHRPGSARITARAGTREAVATVTVRGALAFDLLYDGWTVEGGRAWARLFRLDPREGGAAPQLVLPNTYTLSDVTPSPDGTRIAFVAGSGGNTDVYVADRDGSGLRQLTATPENEDQPAWSADGSMLAFRRWTHTTRARIWVMGADGTNARALLADGDDADQQRPAWSPSLAGGPRLAWVRVVRGADGWLRAQLRTSRADGGDVRAVTAGDAFDDQPSWSPDGTTIVFVRTGGASDGELFLMSAAGGDERPLLVAKPDGAQRAPAWSPDGRHVAFASAHDIDAAGYAYQIYTVRADGSQLVRRTFDAGEKDNPAWLRR